MGTSQRLSPTIPGEAPILAQNAALWTVLVEIDNACTQKGSTVSAMRVPEAVKSASPSLQGWMGCVLPINVAAGRSHSL